MIRLMALVLIFLFSSTVLFAEDKPIPKKSSKSMKRKSRLRKSGIKFQKVFTYFEKGEYQKVITVLKRIEKKIKLKPTKSKNKLTGLLYYWRGMAYSRLNDFENAEINLAKAIRLKYITKDIYYEYGQVLYVSDKYKKARVAFKRSFKKKYKRGVSLYYIAYISQELKDHKKAVSFYAMIEKLPKHEKSEVLQAARMQIADIYLNKVEKLPNSFKEVEKYVIPQYQKALIFDDTTTLAEQIRVKIEELQRKYELVLFRMRNGRPTSRPPYYLRANFLYGINDNVTTKSDDDKTSLEEDEYASHYYTTGVFGRYSFYPNSTYSYSPEFGATMTKYSSEKDTIKALNSYSLSSSLKINYEHLYKNRPATFYIDFSYSYNADYAESGDSFSFTDTEVSMTLSEELQFWRDKPSTFRFDYSITSAEITTSSFNSIGFTYEQVYPIGRTTLFFTNSYDINTYEEASSESLNTTVMTTRIDSIFPTFYGLFNPTLYFSFSNTDFVEDADTGVKSLTSYGINLNRPLSRKTYLTVDINQTSQSASTDTDNYSQQVITFNIDYIY